MVDQDNQNLNEELNEKTREAENKSKQIKKLENNLKKIEDLRKKQEFESNKIIENLALDKKNLIEALNDKERSSISTFTPQDLGTPKLSTPSTQASPQIPIQTSLSKDRKFPNQPKLKNLSPGSIQALENPEPENLHHDLKTSSQELINLKSQLFSAQSQKELVQLELSKVRENYRNFESFLKYRLRQMETGEIFMNRLDLNNYNNF